MNLKNPKPNPPEMQTPLALEARSLALFLAARIGQGASNLDLILTRNNLLALAEQIGALETSLPAGGEA